MGLFPLVPRARRMCRRRGEVAADENNAGGRSGREQHREIPFQTWDLSEFKILGREKNQVSRTIPHTIPWR